MKRIHKAWEPLYYLTHDGVEGDIAFYERSLRLQSHILELGCGTGRLTNGFLAHGHNITAVDNSLYAIEILQRNQKVAVDRGLLSAICADFSTFQVPERYDHVVLAFNGLLCLPDARKIVLLQTVRRHLAPDALFLFDFYEAGDFAPNADDTEEWVYEPQHLKVITHETANFDVYESGVFKPSDGRLEMYYDYFREGRDDLDGHLSYSIVHYPLTEARLRELVDNVGMEIREISRQQVENGTHLFVTVGLS